MAGTLPFVNSYLTSYFSMYEAIQQENLNHQFRIQSDLRGSNHGIIRKKF